MVFTVASLPWAMRREIADPLMANGLTRDTMFDPGNAGYNTDSNWSGYTRRSIGYATTFFGQMFVESNINASLVPVPLFAEGIGAIPPPEPSKRVLVAGAVLSKSDLTVSSARWTYEYSGMPEMKPEALAISEAGPPPDRTSHLDSKGRYPTGDNVVMLDGSVKWRKFTEMEPRNFYDWTYPYRGPCYWW
jgi:hypothetical protein